MFSFLAVQSRRPSLSDEHKARVAKIGARVFSYVEDLQSTEWVSSSDTSYIWTWTNEPSSITGRMDVVADSAVITLGYAGSGPRCDITNDSLTCTVKLGSLDAIYYAEKSGQFILSNRALLIANFLANTPRLDMNLAALSACVANSYAAGRLSTDKTPFLGVKMAHQNSKITWRNGELRISDPDDIYGKFGFGIDEPGDEFYSELRDVFLSGLEPIVASTDDLEIGLTGGQDSRLLAAALKSLGARFTTCTYGFDNNPDVILGKAVAKFLGIAHQQSLPPTRKDDFGEYYTISPRLNIAQQLLRFDGMEVFPPSLGYVHLHKQRIPFSPKFDLRTDGSEIWRGGYANRRFSWFDPNACDEDITPAAIRSIVGDIFSRYSYLLKADLRYEHGRYVQNWIRSFGRKPIAAAERFYLEFEFGRHNVVDFVRASEYRPLFSPFANSELLARIGRLGTRFRRDEMIHYNIMKRLVPGIENIPFDTKRWGFEWSAPITETDRAAWLKRAPIYDSASVSAESRGKVYGEWPIYGTAGSDCWPLIRDELFGYDEGQNIWSFLNRRKTLEAFSSSEIFSPHLSSLFWVIYGLSILMEGDWMEPDKIPEMPMQVRCGKPWGLIYNEMCQQAVEIEADARDSLTRGITDCIDHSGNNNSPYSRAEPRILAKLEDYPSDERAVHYAPGSGRQLRLDIIQKEARRLLIVKVDSEPGSAAANSYVIFSIGDIDAHRTIVLLNLRYRAKTNSHGRCYLAGYFDGKRSDLCGPVLRYEPGWQEVEYAFNLQDGMNARGAVKLEFLLGLPDQSNEVEIDNLQIQAKYSAPSLSLNCHLRAVEQETLDKLRSMLSIIREKYELSDLESDDLMQRAGLNGILVNSTSECELARLERLLRVEGWFRAKLSGRLTPLRLLQLRFHGRLLGGLAQNARHNCTTFLRIRHLWRRFKLLVSSGAISATGRIAWKLTGIKAESSLLALCFGLTEEVRSNLLQGTKVRESGRPLGADH